MRRLVCVAFLGLLAPIASGQGPSTDPPAEFVVGEADLPHGRLLPETGQAVVEAELLLGCGPRPTTRDSTVTFSLVSTAAYASVIFDPPSAQARIPPEKCTDLSFREHVKTKIYVVTRRDAPAMEDFTTSVSAAVTDENGEYGPFEGTLRIRNDYLPLTVINPAQLYVKAEPNSKVVFPVEIQNLGNGPSVIELRAIQPNKNKLDEIIVGTPVHLESRAGNGAAALYKMTRTIDVHTPSAGAYVNAIYQFNVKYATRFDGDAPEAQTDEQLLSFAVQVQGGALVGAPAPSPVFAFVALGGALFIVRRRR